MTNQLDIFDSPQIHGYENNKHSEEIYVEQMKRLSNNSRCILKCLLEGQRISGMDCINGIKSKDMDEPIRMLEYRKRIQEIIRSGVNVEYESASNGCKTWFINSPKT